MRLMDSYSYCSIFTNLIISYHIISYCILQLFDADDLIKARQTAEPRKAKKGKVVTVGVASKAVSSTVSITYSGQHVPLPM